MQINSTPIRCELARLLKKAQWLFTFITDLANPRALHRRPQSVAKSLVTWLAVYLLTLNSGMSLVSLELEIQASVCGGQSRQVTASLFHGCFKKHIVFFLIVRSSHGALHFSVEGCHATIM